MFDPRFLAGPALIAMGGCHLFVAARLWFVHPLNRVFRLGPFVTEAGIRAVINMRMTLLSYGSSLTTYGLASCVFWFSDRGVFDPLVQFLGSLATGLLIWAAIMSLRFIARLWLVRR